MRGQLVAMKQAEIDIWISKIQSIDSSHLRELRQIALLTLFVWSVATIASALSHYYLISPLLTWFAWYFPDVQLVNFDVTSPFSLLISLSMVTGFLVTLPWLCFFLCFCSFGGFPPPSMKKMRKPKPQHLDKARGANSLLSKYPSNPGTLL